MCRFSPSGFLNRLITFSTFFVVFNSNHMIIIEIKQRSFICFNSIISINICLFLWQSGYVLSKKSEGNVNNYWDSKLNRVTDMTKQLHFNKKITKNYSNKCEVWVNFYTHLFYFYFNEILTNQVMVMYRRDSNPKLLSLFNGRCFLDVFETTKRKAKK